MSDALACNGPNCGSHATAPFLGWWHLQNASLVQLHGADERMDFCSWDCLIGFVAAHASEVQAFERRMAGAEE